jgi:hypothetical protein
MELGFLRWPRAIEIAALPGESLPPPGNEVANMLKALRPKQVVQETELKDGNSETPRKINSR